MLTTVQVLQASVIHIASSETLRPALLNAIHICCHFYSKHQNILTLPEPSTVPKILYHIVAKLSDFRFKAAYQIIVEHKVCLLRDFQINADFSSEKEYSIKEYCTILHSMKLMHANWSLINAYF